MHVCVFVVTETERQIKQVCTDNSPTSKATTGEIDITQVFANKIHNKYIYKLQQA